MYTNSPFAITHMRAHTNTHTHSHIQRPNQPPLGIKCMLNSVNIKLQPSTKTSVTPKYLSDNLKARFILMADFHSRYVILQQLCNFLLGPWLWIFWQQHVTKEVGHFGETAHCGCVWITYEVLKHGDRSYGDRSLEFSVAIRWSLL